MRSKPDNSLHLPPPIWLAAQPPDADGERQTQPTRNRWRIAAAL
jgi:hypothetical protein